MALNHLGSILTDLGRLDDALEVTRESVELRRTLADARPDAYLPNLARALSDFGSLLHVVARRDEALEVAEEAITSIKTFFERHPEAFGAWMETLLNTYEEYCEAAGRAADPSLVSPLRSILDSL
jgi:tetratricopeptide (TPR) repeat protein